MLPNTPVDNISNITFEGGKDTGHCAFDKMFQTHVPHILEKIFLYLDYDTFKRCVQVNRTWNELLRSEYMQRKAKTVFNIEILQDEEKLWHASDIGDTGEVKILLFIGLLNINHVDSCYGSTPLIRAAMNGHEDVINCLLDNGAEPNIADASGITPLHMSAKKGHKN